MKSQTLTPVALASAALLAAFLLVAPATAQESKDPAGKKPDSPATEKAQKSGGEDAQKPEEKEFYPAQDAAEALRKSGQVVEQSGDLKISIEGNWFDKFPGFDLGELSAGQKDWLLKRANAVFCTCGCRGDTVARCVVMDPTCQTARQMLGKMLERAGSLSDEELARQAEEARAAAAQDKPE